MRRAQIERQTAETSISLNFVLDEGSQQSQIETGIGFLDHMLTLMIYHGQMDLQLTCQGDLHVDAHHTVEDLGIVLGQAFREALGDKKGIQRYATTYTPMDETLSMISIDISGRPYLHYDVSIPVEKVGTFDTQLVEEFFRAFVNHAQLTLHINLLYGKNGHHIIESIFKGFGRALDQATRIIPGRESLPSTKGLI